MGTLTSTFGVLILGDLTLGALMSSSEPTTSIFGRPVSTAKLGRVTSGVFILPPIPEIKKKITKLIFLLKIFNLPLKKPLIPPLTSGASKSISITGTSISPLIFGVFKFTSTLAASSS